MPKELETIDLEDILNNHDCGTPLGDGCSTCAWLHELDPDLFVNTYDDDSYAWNRR